MTSKGMSERLKKILAEGDAAAMTDRGGVEDVEKQDLQREEEVLSAVIGESKHHMLSRLLECVGELLSSASERDFRDGDSPFTKETALFYALGKTMYPSLWHTVVEAHLDGSGPMYGMVDTIREMVGQSIGSNEEARRLADAITGFTDEHKEDILSGKLTLDDVVGMFTSMQSDLGDESIAYVMSDRIDNIIRCYAGSLVITFSNLARKYHSVLSECSENLSRIIKEIQDEEGKDSQDS